MYILKIDGHQVDFKDDVSIKFNYSNSDASDPAAVKNSFSYTVKLPGTSNNNKIFGDIWKTNRVMISSPVIMSLSNFNQKKKVPFTLTWDGQLIETGYVKLNKITSNFFMQEYDITLYGGIGDFFYSLSTNLDGTKKSLADLYYGFSPAIDLAGGQPVYTPDQEMNEILYRWSAVNIAHSWHLIANMAEPTAATSVKNFITAVPCYTGLYENFDSSSMLINNLERYDSELPQHTQDLLDQSLPTAFTVDQQVYTLYQDPLSAAKSCYSKITYPRDIEGIEAGDLRVTELPIAIKLSKVLDAIAASGNNGGYVVNYSTSVTSSDYWKYGWIMLEKPDFDTTTVMNPMRIADCFAEGTIVPQQGPHVWPHDNQPAPVIWEEDPNDITNIAQPYINIVFDNPITVFETYTTGETIDTSKYATMTNTFNWGHVMQGGTPGQGPTITTYVVDGHLWHGLFCLISLYDGSTLMEQYGTLFHISNQVQGFDDMGFGVDYMANIAQSTWKPLVLAKVNSYFGSSLSDFTVHDSLHTKVNDDGTVSYVTPVLETLPCNFTSTDFRIRISPVPVCYIYSSTDSISQARIPYIDTLLSLPSVGDNAKATRIQTCPYHFGVKVLTSIPGIGYHEFANYIHHKTNVMFNNSAGYINGVVSDTNFYFQVNMTKKNMLSNSPSPFETLTAITKMLNLKYIYDRTAKRISIVPQSEYWIDRTIDLTGRCDYNKDFVHNVILSEQKYIDFSYDKNDTYPLYLWRKSNDKEYEAWQYDTGYEFNSDKKKAFNNVMKQVSLYIPKSQFFKTYEDVIPSIFGTNVFDYTLFNQVQDGSINQETVQEITGNIDPNIKKKGPALLCLFDKAQRQVNAVFPSLVFLNGFYKNWRLVGSSGGQSGGSSDQEQIIAGDDSKMKIVVPNTILSDDFWAMDVLNSQRCWLWCYNRVSGTFPGWGYYFEHSAANWSMPLFTRDLVCYTAGAQTWYPSTKVRASWDQVFDETKYYTENGIEIVRYPTTMVLPSTATTDPATFVLSGVDKTDDSNYLWPKFWKSQIVDMYDNDSRELEAWIDLRGEDPITALRHFYRLENATWIIEKIDGYDRHDIDRNFVKCKLLKVKDKNNYINMTKDKLASLKDTIDKDIEANPSQWDRVG